MAYNSRPLHKTGHQYSFEEVEKAIRKFREDGGLIKKLPDEETPINIMVFPKKFENSSGYEMAGSRGIYGM